MNKVRSRQETGVRPMKEADREKVLEFLGEMDDKFKPPLSSPQRKGSIGGYLDYLRGGGGKVILYENQGRIDGLLGYRIEDDKTLYLANISVKNPSMFSPAAYLLLKRMVESEVDTPIDKMKVTTWAENETMQRTCEKLGLSNTETIEGDYGGERTTLVYESPWDNFRSFFQHPRLPEPVEPGGLD